MRRLRRAKLAGAYLAPHGYFVLRERLVRRRNETRERWNAAWRAGQLAEGRAATAAVRGREYSIELAVAFLSARGLEETQVREGSMPQDALDFAAGILREHLPSGRPIRALQVGNFVGVSLAHVSATLRDLDPASVVMSVDPNITHRGIENPLAHLLALLGHFDLLANNVIVTGYSLEQNLGDDPTSELLSHVLGEQACERVLLNLATVAGHRFDLVLLDGNHTADYLEREMAALRGLLRPGALLVIDDVDADNWNGVVEVYDRATAAGQSFEEVGRQGRVGVLRLRLEAPSPPAPAGTPATAAPEA